MSVVSIVVICDGTSDFCVQDIIQWIVDTHFYNQTFRIQIAREMVPAHSSLDIRIRRTHELYGPDIIVCHRDAENRTLAQRTKEIIEAANLAQVAAEIVPAVPIRMIESWLLADEKAIRNAANNRNGSNALALPQHTAIENDSNPKQTLFNALETATGLPPQRLKRFNTHQARSRITGFIDTFEPLRKQAGFKRFEQDLVKVVGLFTDQ